ncbi:hypothetical protein HanOQP8_Chr14g0526981 [Helianthus annuus]|nr:hypothetical protein HanOQP8_Chr14g0526981 [Helianthus annuus]
MTERCWSLRKFNECELFLSVITPMIGGIPEPADLAVTASRVPPQAAEAAAMWLEKNRRRSCDGNI